MSVLRLTCELQIYIVASFFLYTLFLISIIDTKPSPTAAHCSTWIVGLIMEWILLGASLATNSSEHREPTAGHGKGEARHGVTTWEAIEIFVDLVRIILICALIAFYALFVLLRWSKARSAYRGENGTTEETLGLLNGNANENGNANGNDYGSTNPDKADEEVPGWVRPDKVKSKSWWEYIRGYSLFFPYLWPAKSVRLQIVVLICIYIVGPESDQCLGPDASWSYHKHPFRRRRDQEISRLGPNLSIHSLSANARRQWTSRCCPLNTMVTHRPVFLQGALHGSIRACPWS